MGRKFDVFVSSSIALNRDEIETLLRGEGDDAFWSDVSSLEVECSCHPEDAVAAYAIFTLEDGVDPLGMQTEMEWFYAEPPARFDANVSVNLRPTEEQLQQAREDGVNV